MLNLTLGRCGAVLIFLGLGLGGTANANSALEPVVIQLKWEHQFQFAGYYAAQEKGYFAAAGLEVDIRPTRPGLDPVREVVEGRAHYGVGSSDLLLRRASGEPVVALAAIYQHSAAALIALQRDDLTSIHDVVGKTVMLEPQSTELLAYMQTEGVGTSAYTTVEHNLNCADLLAGRVDVISAYLTCEPFILAQADVDFTIFSPRASGLDFYGDILFTSEQELKEHPERTQAFRQAALQGWHYALKNPEELADLIGQRFGSDTTREQLLFEAREMNRLINPKVVEIGYQHARRWERIAEIYRELGFLAGPVDMAEFLYQPAKHRNTAELLAGLAGLSVLVLLFTGILAWYRTINRRIAQRGSELAAINLALQAEVQRRIQSERDLRASKDRFRQVAEAATNLIWETDARGLFTYVSPGSLATLGYAPEEMVGKLHFFDLFPPEHREALKLEALAVFARKESFIHFPNYVMRKDGSLLHVETSGSPVLDAAGNLLGYRGTDTDITARKQFEQALKASEERYRSYVEHAPFGIFAVNSQRRFVDANPTACRMTGYGREELLTMAISDLHPPEAEEATRIHFQNLLAGQTSRVEVPFRTKQGERRYWSVTATRLNADLFLGLTEDTTQRRQAEEQLNLLARRGQAMLEMPHAAERMSEPAFLEYAMKLAERLTGSQTSFVHQASENAPGLEIQTGRATGGQGRAQVIAFDQILTPGLQAPDAGPGPLQRMISLPVVSDGKTRMLVGIGNKPEPYAETDVETLQLLANEMWHIVSRRRAEKERIASEKLLDETGQVGAIGGWELDFRTRTLRWSAQTRRLHEVPPDYKPTLEAAVSFYPPEAQALLVPALKEAEERGAGWDLELPFITAQGRHLWIRATGQVRREGGQPATLLGIFQDITERKQKEAENATLQNQLLQSQKMESVGLLAGGIAHDFNNLLQIITGFSEVLINEVPSDQPHHKDVQEILKAADRATSLTQQLLAFSRQQQLARRPTSLNDLLTNLHPMLDRLLGEDIRLTLALAPNLALAHADPGQLEQVVMNLVINARDAMPRGGTISLQTGSLTVDKEAASRIVEAEPGDYIALDVCDTGVGMEPEVMARIFEPFFTTKAKGKGTGLGLSVVYGIARQHQGFMEVTSEVGVGTRFRMALPALGNQAEAGAPDGATEATRRESLQGRGERILAIEDEDGVREFLKQALASSGYSILAAATLEEARRLLESTPEGFDLVLSDVVLPDGNGLDLALDLRILRPGLPVVLASGYTADRAREEDIYKHGFTLLQKPYAIKALLQAVRQHLAPQDST